MGPHETRHGEQHDGAQHGLHTVHDLTWMGRLRLTLRRQSRRIYRMIRHPRQRSRGRIRAWLADRIHNRDLWRMRRHSVASGVGGGLFVAMLPIPLQSVVAAVLGVARGWNLPAAILCTWLSNPFTFLPIFYASKKSVTVLYHMFGAEPSIHDLTPSKVRDLDLGELVQLLSRSGPEFLIGSCLVGLMCAAVGFVLVHALWHLFAHHAHDPAEERRDAREKERQRRRRASGSVPG